MQYYLSGFQGFGSGFDESFYPYLPAIYPNVQIGFEENINFKQSGRHAIGVVDAATQGAAFSF